MNQDYHVFQGMRQDNPPIRQNTNFLWDAYNIRLTNRGDNSLLNVSNEKGNRELLTLEGRYVGHCIVGDYLVVFTVSRNRVNKNYYTSIYRIDKVFNVKILISKLSLAMNLAYIETLGVYEGEFVQKVYWVDGINQLRYINLADSNFKSDLYPEGKLPITDEIYLDSSPEFRLNHTIEVERVAGGGIFTAGVIQYAFTYYMKYGAETGIVDMTPLYYISEAERGLLADETVGCSFKVKIKNPDTRFDYLRLYSIQRTSLNGTPLVKIVKDIKLK